MTITPTALITLFKEQLENESKRIAEEHSLAKRGDYLVWWYFLRLHNLLPVDIEESNVDGGGELGLDILRIDDDSVVHFYQFCNPERMERGFPTGDVDKIISGLQLVFSRRHHAVANERLRARIDEIFQTVPSGYKIHLVTSGTGIAAEAVAKMDNFVDQIGGSKDLFTWQLEDIVFLQDWFYRRSLPTVEQPIFFEIFRQAPYPVRAADHDCWMFHANGGILATLYEQYGEQLLQQNIRVFEGSKATNASIKAACTTDDAANFFHFNNGVTFLCETAVWDAFTSKLTIHRAQIVNGGQTVRVLHDAYKGDTLRPEVYVPVRVITSQGDKEFGNNVAVNLNNQNKVDDSFLKSNHPRVIQLSHSLASRGWYLERRENEIQYMADAERSAVEQRLGGKLDGRIIRIREGTQAYAATYIRAPELAKKNPRRLFMSTSDGGSFERIYNEELSADKFVAAHRIKTYVDEFVNQFVKIKRKKQDAADRKRDYRDYVGEELSEYQTDVDQSLPQSAIFLAAIIFEEHIRIRKKDQDTLLKDLETNARSILSGKIQQILTFARENPTVANKSWPTLLKSQAFFDQFVSYLRGVVSQETKAG